MSEAARSNRQYTEDPQGSNDSLSYVTQPFLLVIALNGLMKTLIFLLPSGANDVCDLWLLVQRQRRGKFVVTFNVFKTMKGEGRVGSSRQPNPESQKCWWRMFLAWSDPLHGGRLSRLFKHQQATATKRDGSQDDCKRLTAIIFLTPVVFLSSWW